MIKFIVKKIVYFLGYTISKVEAENNTAKFSDLCSEKLNGFAELERNCKKCKEIKLHFGCGPRVFKGWINVDLAYVPYHNFMQYYTDKYYPEKIRGDKTDFYAIDVTKTGLPLPDNSVDVIFHEDFLEHLNQRDQLVFLAETYRVLKPGGVHRVNTPDLLSSMNEHSDFSKGISGVYIDEWDRHRHLNILTTTILHEMALMVGYREVTFNSRDHSRSQLLPLEYRPDPNDRAESGNIFADLIK